MLLIKINKHLPLGVDFCCLFVVLEVVTGVWTFVAAAPALLIAAGCATRTVPAEGEDTGFGAIGKFVPPTEFPATVHRIETYLLRKCILTLWQ